MFYLFSLKEDTLNYNCEMKYMIKIIVQKLWSCQVWQIYTEIYKKHTTANIISNCLTDLIGIINLSSNWNIIVRTEKKIETKKKLYRRQVDKLKITILMLCWQYETVRPIFGDMTLKFFRELRWLRREVQVQPTV